MMQGMFKLILIIYRYILSQQEICLIYTIPLSEI